MRTATGDCLVVMETIKEDLIDCIITSPPYNLGKNYLSYKDLLPYEQYLDWMEQLAISFKRVLKENGHIFLNIGYTNKEPWIAYDVAYRFRKHFVLQNNIIWLKHIKIGLDTFGIYKPIASKRYTTPVWENIFHFTPLGDSLINRTSISGEYGPKKGNYEKAYTPKAQLTRYEGAMKRRLCKKLFGHSNWKKEDIKNDKNFQQKLVEYKKEKPFEYNKSKDEGNIWYIPYTPIAKLAKELGSKELGTNKTGKNNHPAIFPVELPKKCLMFADYKDDWFVLDPFLGTGSTLVACQELGISKAIGIDIDKNYIKFSKDRLEKLSS